MSLAIIVKQDSKAQYLCQEYLPLREECRLFLVLSFIDYQILISHNCVRIVGGIHGESCDRGNRIRVSAIVSCR